MTGKAASRGSKSLFVEPRTRLVEWVREQLIGPPPVADGARILRRVLPTERFPCGAIYPTTDFDSGIDPASEDVDEIEVGTDPAGEKLSEPATVRRYVPPSSLGFSFFIRGEDIQFQLLCSAARYEHIERDDAGQYSNDWQWHRLPGDGSVEEEFQNISCSGREERESFSKFYDSSAQSDPGTENSRGRLDIQWRRFADGWIVTVSLCNVGEVSDPTGKDFVRERARKTLFEARLRCVIESGDVGVYPRIDRSLLDPEQQEIELQYAHRHIYAIGHGCAVDWIEKDGKVVELRSETMPMVEVPQMTADTESGGLALSLVHLADMDTDHARLLPELATFVDGYAQWVGEQLTNLRAGSSEDQVVGDRIVGRMKVAIARMRQGLKSLDSDSTLRLAFALANRAMLDQMRQHDRVRNVSRSDEAYCWRPFQLAFLLTVLESTASSDSEFRDTVDLIWFPTGGGKTEAYLGLIAFQIALRRLRHPNSGSGTAVLMRYTLRLLARDQFIRATRLICALELIRRSRNDLGAEPISIGMWVGDATSPNSFDNASALLRRVRQNGQMMLLVLDQCPWCADTFDSNISYRSTASSFQFVCKNQSCGFGSKSGGVLPCNVVDEAMYSEPPTMLVATADKFARLAWDERANAFFGANGSRPPELIIQDELHLIAGALGSIAGLYEAALDTVIQVRGIYPKYIASTATIRMADHQVKRLYGRDVAIFPPPGLSCDDSYFARMVPLQERPGRIYIGYLAPMLNRQQCMAPLAAVLLQAPHVLFAHERDADLLLDAWWTAMVYHGSLKGVGNSHTAYLSDVRDFVRLLPGVADYGGGQHAGKQKRSNPVIAQLTSRQPAETNANIFARLQSPQDQESCLDAVLATNMISVGLDVSRLALMTINGQPLTTAEYIQASSRVGRGAVPGVVFANYYRDQARSLSHYESFRPYHEAFYRFVEPTSVTPYAHQARKRALHAALVIVMRHAGVGLLDNDAAGQFDPSDPKIAAAIECLERRCQASALERGPEVSGHIKALVAQWRDEVERCQAARRGLDYSVSGQTAGRDRLLYNYSDRIHGLWLTLQSMRNVENTALLKAL